LAAAIDNGAECVQVREKQLDGGLLSRHVAEVIGLARPKGATIIVNDRADVALAAGADGVHIGQHDLTVHEVRKVAGRSLLVGVSTHDLDQAEAAVHGGADYCGVGAMFPTSLKPDRKPSGIAYLRAFIERFPDTPHLAIGGVTAANVIELAQAGARGVAVSSAICGADDPGGVTLTIVGSLHQRGSRVSNKASHVPVASAVRNV
jgi:thiamine-phosphate pyrophosphorylase